MLNLKENYEMQGISSPHQGGVPGVFPFVSLVPKVSNKKSEYSALGKRSAIELIEQHGEDAPLHAAMRADELMETGDQGDGINPKLVAKARLICTSSEFGSSSTATEHFTWGMPAKNLFLVAKGSA